MQTTYAGQNITSSTVLENGMVEVIVESGATYIVFPEELN